jgi:hypothetical protein
MASLKVDPGKLTETAWEMISEALEKGSMTMPSMKTMILDPKTFVELVKWLANMNKKRKYVSAPEDFQAKKTSAKGEKV